MSKSAIASIIIAIAALSAPTASAASAADTTIAPDPVASQLTALDGTVVWASGKFGAQVLMQRTAAGIARVQGAPLARSYRSVDLGRDRHGKLVLTYLRCSSGTNCHAVRDDLRGHRATFHGLTAPRCSLSTAPAVWGKRIAYGITCHKPGSKFTDESRTALYVKTGSAAPKRLRLPRAALKYEVASIGSVDLRGRRVSAATDDIYEFTFSETVTGTDMHSYMSAVSEGDDDEDTAGLALGPGGVTWAVVDSTGDDGSDAHIERLRGSCLDVEDLVTPDGSNSNYVYLASDVALDGTSMYIVVPGTGIVTHAFAPVHQYCGH